MINKYKTTSLNLASALHATSTAQLEYIFFPPDSNRAEFTFDYSKDPSFHKIIEMFWSRQLPIDAQTYSEAQRYLKSRLYEEKNDNR